MSELVQTLEALAAAARRDPMLAPALAQGALILCPVDGDPVAMDDRARGIAGSRGSLPAATADRLRKLAGGLASRSGIRLERLRFGNGPAAPPATCACKLVAEAGREALAVAIAPAELRRLGVTPLPEPEPPPAAERPAERPQAPAAEPAPQPQRPVVRLLWQSDADGRLTRIDPDPAPWSARGAEHLRGRSWSDVVGDGLIDRQGGLVERFGRTETWSGHELLWRSRDGRAVPVELSGVPVLDAGRILVGYRGFAIARLSLAEPWPEAEGLPEAPAAPEREPENLVPAEQMQAAPAAAETTEASEAAPEVAEPPATEPPEPDVATEPSEPALAAEPPAEPDLTEPEPEDEPPVEAEAAADEAAGSDSTAEAPAAESVPAAVEASPEPIPTPEAEPAPEESPVAEAPANVVPLRNGHLTAVRPVLEPSKPNLSSAERNAFREIARALGARIAGEPDADDGPRLPPAQPFRLPTEERAPAEPAEQSPAAPVAAGRPRQANSHADLLDRLPLAVLVSRGEEPVYANRALLDLLDFADLADLAAAGGVSRLIKGAARADGGPVVLIGRTGRLIEVEAELSSLPWQGDSATLAAFSRLDDTPPMTPEEAEEAELAAEFAAEDEEAAARVAALRLDVDAREGRIAELVAMLDTATDGVVTIDERGRILAMNRTAEALFGYDQREVTGELFTLLFAPESHAPALDYLEGLKGGGVASVLNDGREVAGRVRQGGRIPLFMTMGRIAESPERRYCAVLRDITAWKKTEADLVEARKAAERSSAQKSDVLAKISHEIRTPLNAIIGFAEVMAEERFGPIANERYKEYLRDIHQSGGYVISLVNDLLDLAKIEAGKLDLDFVSVNLNDIALSAVSLLQAEAQRGRVVLRSGLSPKLPPVVADERSLRQIVLNLLSNAVKFTDAGGQVIVSTALGDQGEAILRVRDTGIGMDDEEVKLALEPFRQVPTTRRSGGTGLGLPLTKALVEANRAAMAITSVKKEGTLVEITFPPQRVLAG